MLLKQGSLNSCNVWQGGLLSCFLFQCNYSFKFTPFLWTASTTLCLYTDNCKQIITCIPKIHQGTWSYKQGVYHWFVFIFKYNNTIIKRVEFQRFPLTHSFVFYRAQHRIIWCMIFNGFLIFFYCDAGGFCFNYNGLSEVEKKSH